MSISNRPCFIISNCIQDVFEKLSTDNKLYREEVYLRDYDFDLIGEGSTSDVNDWAYYISINDDDTYARPSITRATYLAIIGSMAEDGVLINNYIKVTDPNTSLKFLTDSQYNLTSKIEVFTHLRDENKCIAMLRELGNYIPDGRNKYIDNLVMVREYTGEGERIPYIDTDKIAIIESLMVKLLSIYHSNRLGKYGLAIRSKDISQLPDLSRIEYTYKTEVELFKFYWPIISDKFQLLELAVNQYRESTSVEDFITVTRCILDTIKPLVSWRYQSYFTSGYAGNSALSALDDSIINFGMASSATDDILSEEEYSNLVIQRFAMPGWGGSKERYAIGEWLQMVSDRLRNIITSVDVDKINAILTSI